METNPQSHLRIDYFLDVICPWCWIGLRNLRSAIQALKAEQPEVEVHIQWHASTLIAHIPPEGVPYQQFYIARLGSPEAVVARRAQVQMHADTVGIRLRYDLIERFPNSMLACALLNHAQRELSLHAMCDFAENVYAAYFQRGENIGDPAVLMQLAQSAAVTCTPELLQQALRHQGQGAPSGVPHYVFNGEVQLTGAVPPQSLLAAMRQALVESQAA